MRRDKISKLIKMHNGKIMEDSFNGVETAMLLVKAYLKWLVCNDRKNRDNMRRLYVVWERRNGTVHKAQPEST